MNPTAFVFPGAPDFFKKPAIPVVAAKGQPSVKGTDPILSIWQLPNRFGEKLVCRQTNVATGQTVYLYGSLIGVRNRIAEVQLVQPYNGNGKRYLFDNDAFTWHFVLLHKFPEGIQM